MRLIRPVFACLEIRDDRLYAVEIKGDSIVRWGNWRLERSLTADARPDQQLAFGEAVGRLLRGAGFEARTARLALADDTVVARVIELPPIPRGELARAVSYLAEKELPIRVADAAWSWDVVGSNATAIAVCIVGAWRDEIAAMEAALKHAGLRLDVAEPRAFAIARAIGSESAILLETSDRFLQVTALIPGAPAFVRREPAVSDSVARHQRVAELIADGASRHALQRGQGEAPPVLIADRLDAQLEGFANDSRRAAAAIAASRPVRPSDMPSGDYLALIGLAIKPGGFNSRPDPAKPLAAHINLLNTRRGRARMVRPAVDKRLRVLALLSAAAGSWAVVLYALVHLLGRHPPGLGP